MRRHSLILLHILGLRSVSCFLQRLVLPYSQSPFIATSPRHSNQQLFASSSNITTSVPEPLATENEWTAYLDETSTGLCYYFNGKTGESRWVPPTSTFPAVKLSRSQKRIAEEKQKQYRAATAASKAKDGSTIESESKGFFTSMLKEKIGKKEEEDWFSFLAPVESKANEQKEEAGTSAQSESSDWFGGLKARAASQSSIEATIEQPSTDISDNGSSTEASKQVKKESFFDKLVAKTRVRVAQETFTESSEEEDFGDDEYPTVIVPDIGGFVLAAPQKMLWGGEDAIFTKSRTFGVFDGVSGAEKLTGRPLYSKMLAQLCDERIATEQTLTIQDMQKILVESVKICNEKATGATTALLASIGSDGFLRVLNVGDASLVVVRGDKVVARTKEISHFYECPYQFSEISPDKPRDGTKLNCELVKGDLLVSGSDGVFDNLPDALLIEAIQAAGSSKSASLLAKAIGEKARKVSLDRKAETPYAVAAKKQNNPDYASGLGGKVDDISCVVVRYE